MFECLSYLENLLPTQSKIFSIFCLNKWEDIHLNNKSLGF